MNIYENKRQLLSKKCPDINNGAPTLGAELVTSFSAGAKSSSQFSKENVFTKFPPGARKLTGFEPIGSAKSWILPFYYEFCIKPLFNIFGKCSLWVENRGQQTFLVNGQTVNSLGFVSHRVSRQSVNEWVWLCDNKTLLTEMSPGSQPSLPLD